jgi:hypothetical protein
MLVSRISIVLFLISFFSNVAFAQATKAKDDTSQIIYAFKHPKIQGSMRYFKMATENQNAASNSFANAINIGLAYETRKYYGFQFGISQYTIFNIASSDMTFIDPKTNQTNRYEIGLFDQEQVERRSDINRLENLYVKYQYKNSKWTLGKQSINTPFINLQDGRMRPTQVGGFWSDLRASKKSQIEVGVLWEILPRGTTQWYSISESFGIYPSGINTEGNKSNYLSNISSKYVGLLGLNHQLNPGIKLKFWDVYVDNVFNTMMFQVDMKKKNWIAGLQYIEQNVVNQGGNTLSSKTYFSPNQKSRIFGGKIGWEKSAWKTSLNFTRITAEGRYLMPREWGRDPFYTFMPRERNEGFGDLTAYVAKTSYYFKNSQMLLQSNLGYFHLPDVKNVSLNKYGMPSYWQWNFEMNYPLKKVLNGLELQFLYVYKKQEGNSYSNEKYVINKVNMSNYNIVLNYLF